MLGQSGGSRRRPGACHRGWLRYLQRAERAGAGSAGHCPGTPDHGRGAPRATSDPYHRAGIGRSAAIPATHIKLVSPTSRCQTVFLWHDRPPQITPSPAAAPARVRSRPDRPARRRPARRPRQPRHRRRLARAEFQHREAAVGASRRGRSGMQPPVGSQPVRPAVQRRCRLVPRHLRHQPRDRPPPRYRAGWTAPGRTAPGERRSAQSPQSERRAVRQPELRRVARAPAPRRPARGRPRRRRPPGNSRQRGQQQAAGAGAEVEDPAAPAPDRRRPRAPPRSASRSPARGISVAGETAKSSAPELAPAEDQRQRLARRAPRPAAPSNRSAGRPPAPARRASSSSAPPAPRPARGPAAAAPPAGAASIRRRPAGGGRRRRSGAARSGPAHSSAASRAAWSSAVSASMNSSSSPCITRSIL